MAIAALLAGCGDDETTTSAAGNPVSEDCAAAEQPQPKQVSFKAPEQVLERGQRAPLPSRPAAATFTIELDTETAPRTANSFAFLAEEGVYDDTAFHRIVTEPS